MRIASCSRARVVPPLAPLKYHGASSAVGCQSGARKVRLERAERRPGATEATAAVILDRLAVAAKGCSAGALTAWMPLPPIGVIVPGGSVKPLCPAVGTVPRS